MTDIVSSQKRSLMMSGIKSHNTKPEIYIRKQLHNKGFRYRLNVKKMPGKPDLVLKKFSAVIFVHGCFWHGHNCKYFKWPKTRPDFWSNKINNNKDNDSQVLAKLILAGWRICVIWECAIKNKEKLPKDLIETIIDWLYGIEKYIEISS